MIKLNKSDTLNYLAKSAAMALLWAMCVPPATLAQDRDQRDRFPDSNPPRDRIVRIEPGTIIAVRNDEGINANKGDGRIYTGIVDQDVRDRNGRLAIPRGSRVELVVRVARDNDLILDLDSVTVDRVRYGLRSEPNRVESRRDDSVVGAIVGAIGGEARGRAVRIPRDSMLTFRLQRPLEMGVEDRGVLREGYHYHPYPER
jgi:hypothetical protein